MISINDLTILLLALEAILLVFIIIVAIKNRFQCALKIIMIIMLMCILFVAFLLFSIGGITGYHGGTSYNDIESVDKVTYKDSTTYHIIFKDGSYFDAENIAYGTTNKLVKDCDIIKTNVFGIEIRSKGNILLIRPVDIDIDSMSESEKKHYIITEQ